MAPPYGSLSRPLSLHQLKVADIPRPPTTTEDAESEAQWDRFLKAVVVNALSIIEDSIHWTEGKTYHSHLPERTITRSRAGHFFSFPNPSSLARTLSRRSTQSVTTLKRGQKQGSNVSEEVQGVGEKAGKRNEGKRHDKNEGQAPREDYDPHSKYGWHLRSTKIPEEFEYEDLKRTLLIDHSPQEQEYIKSLSKVEKIETIAEGLVEVWHFQYSLPFPTTNRDFVELLITKELPPSTSASPALPIVEEGTTDEERNPNSEGLRSFLVVSIPVEDDRVKDGKKFVRGKYVSVEQIRELPNPDGKPGKYIEWRMATSSSPGGSIPSSISEMAMPGTIAEDVPMYLKWLKEWKKKDGEGK